MLKNLRRFYFWTLFLSEIKIAWNFLQVMYLQPSSLDLLLLYECSMFQSWDKNISFLQHEFDLQSLILILLTAEEKKKN